MSDAVPTGLDLLGQLTLTEKVALLAGDGMWWTTPLERLGIGRVKMTDGPNGVRGDGASRTTSTCFPVGVCLGATFDVDLLERIGRALATEAEAKSAHLLLGPTLNLQRHPVTGRVFECFSEDPVVAARLGTAWVRGLQAGGRVGACVKHYVANEQEFQRHTIDSQVPARALRELYLRPFEETVAEAGPWAVMSAYNRVNGVYASSQSELLEGVLRGEWAFDGAVVSDWGAALETVANAIGGLDIEMPGPPRTRGAALLDAVESGEVGVDVIDRRVQAVLGLLDRAGRLGDTTEPPERTLDDPAHRELAFEAAVSGMVLLHDDGGLLPLEAPSSVALIGPNVDPGRIQGGGSSIVFPHRTVPLPDALAAALDGVPVTTAVGAHNDRYVPLPDRAWFHDPDGAPGLRCDYVNGGDPAGEVVATRTVGRPYLEFVAAVPDGVDRFDHCCCYLGTITVAAGGEHDLGLTAAGPARVFVDGALVIDNWSDPAPGDSYFSFGSAERRAVLTFEPDRPYEVLLEYHRPPEVAVPGLRLGVGAAPDGEAVMAEAVEAATAAEVAVVVVGLTEDWESEGFDRPSFALPGRQAELIETVAKANPRTVVAVNAGSPVEMDWAGAPAAVLQCWYAGQEQGSALAAVLTGAAEPGGRLPLTIPKRLEDTPAYPHYPGRDGKAVYGEDLLVGYRWYEHADIAPRYPFGHGLGYTTWEWSPPTVRGEGTDLVVTVALTNTGARHGSQVVQVYRRWLEEEDGTRPVRELAGFARVTAEPAETVVAEVMLDERAFRRWDGGRWVVPSGEVAIEVGASALDVQGRVRGSMP